MPEDFWSIPVEELLTRLQTTVEGFAGEEAQKRILLFGDNLLKPRKHTDVFTLLLAQFKSPIIFILLAATALSFFLHDRTNALIILAIVMISGLLSFWQEAGAADAVDKLLNIVKIKTKVLRDGKVAEIFVEQVVPGDIIIVTAGDVKRLKKC